MAYDCIVSTNQHGRAHQNTRKHGLSATDLLQKVPSLLQQRDDVANIIPVGDSWHAQVRRKGHPVQTKTFPGWLRLHSRSLTPSCRLHHRQLLPPPSEIVRLRWEDFNHQDRTILIRDRKDPQRKLGNNQIVPLLGRSCDIVCAQTKAGELIFPLNGKSWSSIFPRACSDLGIHDRNLYDLRHEGISRLVESGKYSIPEVMLVAGHKDSKQMMCHLQLVQLAITSLPRRVASWRREW